MRSFLVSQKEIERVLLELISVFEHCEQAVAILDSDRTIRFINEAWMRMHGYDNADEIVGKGLNMFYSQERFENDIQPLIEEALQRTAIIGPTEQLRKDGNAFPTQTKIISVEDELAGKVGFIVLATDMSEQKVMEAKLNNLERLKQRITELTGHLTGLKARLSRESKLRAQAEEKLKQYRSRLSELLEQINTEITDEQQGAAAGQEAEQPNDEVEAPQPDPGTGEAEQPCEMENSPVCTS